MLRYAWLPFVLAGCLTRNVLVAPVRIAEVAGPLRTDGAAEVGDVEGEALRVEAREVDQARGRRLGSLVAPCVAAPPAPFHLERGCRFARERRLVTLSRPDPWATAGLWGGAVLTTVLIGTLMGVSGMLDADR